MNKCSNCKGSGKQVFHGPFESVNGLCNFCQGSGLRKDQVEWFETKLKPGILGDANASKTTD